MGRDNIRRAFPLSMVGHRADMAAWARAGIWRNPRATKPGRAKNVAVGRFEFEGDLADPVRTLARAGALAADPEEEGGFALLEPGAARRLT